MNVQYSGSWAIDRCKRKVRFDAHGDDIHMRNIGISDIASVFTLEDAINLSRHLDDAITRAKLYRERIQSGYFLRPDYPRENPPDPCVVVCVGG